jgi:hypothetical protein
MGNLAPQGGSDRGTTGLVSRDPELQLLTGLSRELAKLGLNVGLSDARPAVMIRTSQNPTLWITVDESAEFFEWADAEHRHPVDDPPGAAAVISEHAKTWRSGSGEAS